MGEVMLLLTYTPREDVRLEDYHRWLREVDNPFFNNRPTVRHYTNWRVTEPKVGTPTFSHFDLLYVYGPDGFDKVFGDEAIVEFARAWVAKWGQVPDPSLDDQSVNYQISVCKMLAGPDNQ